MVTWIELPEDKDSFKIGEVAKLLEVEPYVLRYWESEFIQLQPRKTSSGQRLYTRVDIELLGRIRYLLYEEQYTIAGARRQLELDPAGEEALPGDPEAVSALADRVGELERALSEAQAARDAASSQLASAAAQRDEAQAACASAEAALAAWQAREEELLSEVQQARDGQTSLAGELDAARAQLATQSQALHAARAQADATRTDLDAQWERLHAQAGEDVLALEAELDASAQHVARLEARLEAMALELERAHHAGAGQARARQLALVASLRRELGQLEEVAWGAA